MHLTFTYIYAYINNVLSIPYKLGGVRGTVVARWTAGKQVE